MSRKGAKARGMAGRLSAMDFVDEKGVLEEKEGLRGVVEKAES